ncbi:hypothetical protein CSHISOI_11026, partial [Colletotrichum shisoi]
SLTFLTINLPSAKIFIFIKRSFTNNVNLTLQLKFIIILANKKLINNIGNRDTFTIRSNVVHFSLTKSKYVTQSMLTLEVYGIVVGVDIRFVLSKALRIITNRLNLPLIPTIIYTNLYLLYKCLVKLSTTKEKRLIINIIALR